LLTSPTGTIAAVLEGMRDGRLVAIDFDAVVGYEDALAEDALAEDAHRSFTRDGDARVRPQGTVSVAGDGPHAGYSRHR